MTEGNFLETIKALYGLPTSGNRWYAQLLHTSREMGSNTTHFDPDVWIRGCGGGYDYNGTHTNDVLVVSVDPNYIFDKLNETYKIKDLSPPKVHLGCDCAQVKKGDITRWVMGSSIYITECLRMVCTLLKVTTLRKDKLPCIPGDNTKLDLSIRLCETQHRIYQQLVGMTEWAVNIGRFDISYALNSINRFSASPREGHLSRLVKIFGYLKSVNGRHKSIVALPEDIEEISGKGDNMKYWLEKYTETSDTV